MELLEDYKKAKEELMDFFGCDQGYYPVEDYTEETWCEYSSGTVSWEPLLEYDYDDDEEWEFNYSGEIYGTSRWEKEGYVMFTFFSDTGDGKYLAVFSTNQKIEAQRNG
jgi:hypothetical protein